MAEQQWLAAKSTTHLIDHPACKDRRKLRLLAAACARRMLTALPAAPAFSGIIDAAEHYADDPAARPDAVAARKPLRQTAKEIAGGVVTEPLKKALVILIDLTNDALEGHTAGVANAAWVMSHPRAAVRTDAASAKAEQADLLRDIIGNPYRPVCIAPAWLTREVVSLARAAYDERTLPGGDLDRARLAVLADALEEAGCNEDAILTHLRSAGPHVRGCWALDLILGKR